MYIDKVGPYGGADVPPLWQMGFQGDGRVGRRGTDAKWNIGEGEISIWG